MLATITNGVYTAQVDSLRPAGLPQRPEGFEHLWVGDPQYWKEHAPVLFPIVGALRDNRTQIGGEWYSMNRHGFAKVSQFTLVEEGKDRLATASPPVRRPKSAIPSSLPSPWPTP